MTPFRHPITRFVQRSLVLAGVPLWTSAQVPGSVSELLDQTHSAADLTANFAVEPIWPGLSAAFLFDGGGAFPYLLFRQAGSGTFSVSTWERATGAPRIPGYAPPVDLLYGVRRVRLAEGVPGDPVLVLLRKDGRLERRTYARGLLSDPLETLGVTASDVFLQEGGLATVDDVGLLTRYVDVDGHWSPSWSAVLPEAAVIVLEVSDLGLGIELLVAGNGGKTHALDDRGALRAVPSGLEALSGGRDLLGARRWRRTARGREEDVLTLAASGSPATAVLRVFQGDGRGGFRPGFEVEVPFPSAYFCPVDLDRDGNTDLAFADLTPELTWSVLPGDGRGGFGLAIEGLGTRDILASTGQLPWAEAFFTRWAEPLVPTVGPNLATLLPGAIPLPPFEVLTLINKVCMIIMNMQSMADGLEAGGHPAEATLLREIATKLEELKTSGRLHVAELGADEDGEGRLGMHDPTTKAITLDDYFIGPGFDGMAACNPQSPEYWRLFRVLLHEGDHAAHCSLHPESQATAIRVLLAILEVWPMGPPLGGTPTPVSIVELIGRIKIEEKYYILESEGAITGLRRACASQDPAEIAGALRDALKELLEACGVQADPADFAYGMGQSNAGNPLYQVSFGDFRVRVECLAPDPQAPNQNHGAEVSLRYCGRNFKIPYPPL